jgi:hypothetical protein
MEVFQMTVNKCDKRGRQAESMQKAAPAAEVKSEVCGICGSAIGSGPKLVYMPVVEGQLREVRVCPFCFLKIVMGVKA